MTDWSSLPDRLRYALVIGLILTLIAFLTRRKNQGLNFQSAAFFPLYLLIVLLMPMVFDLSIWERGALKGFYRTAFFAFSAFFLSIFVYDLALLLLLPLLRKRMSSPRCASLWLLPFVFMAFVNPIVSSSAPFRPVFYLRINETVFRWAFWIWLAGFLLFFFWQTASHLSFRRQILRNAVPANAADMQILSAVCTRLNVENSVTVVRSGAVRAPLTIGIRKRNLRIVLPLDRAYSNAELAMILRHELLHLKDGHNDLKFSMSLVAALGWFFPGQWLGLRKAAEDVEVYCDELTVSGLSEEEKRQYAALILNNAGTSRGYTTCLSASAEGLRYRLSRLRHPVERRKGWLLFSAILTLYLLGIGLVCFAPGGDGMGQMLRANQTTAIPVDTLQYSEQFPAKTIYVCQDSDGLLDALDAVRLYQLPAYQGKRFPIDRDTPHPCLTVLCKGEESFTIAWEPDTERCFVYLNDTNQVYLADKMPNPDALLSFGTQNH